MMKSEKILENNWIGCISIYANLEAETNHSYLDKTLYGRVSVDPINYNGDIKVGFTIGAYSVVGGSMSGSVHFSEIFRLIAGVSNKSGCGNQK